MRQVAIAFFVAVLLFAGWGIAPSRGQEKGRDVGSRMMIALDLMDLEIPGGGGGDEMELPPIQGTERPEPEPLSPVPPQKPARVESSKGESQTAGRSVPFPEPGLAPFLLEEPGAREGKVQVVTEPQDGRSPEALMEELPAELKTVAPPPSRAESLKLPSGMDVSTSGRSDVPEIPLLKGGDREQQRLSPDGGDKFLTLKPLPDRRGAPGASLDVRSSQERRRPEDYLQVREDMDSRLIELYERYYKNR